MTHQVGRCRAGPKPQCAVQRETQSGRRAKSRNLHECSAGGCPRLPRSRAFHQRVQVVRATPWNGGRGSGRCGDKLQQCMYQLGTPRYGARVFACITSDRMWMNRLGLGDSWR